MESRRQTYITLGGLVVVAVVLFTISGIDRFKNGHGLDGVIGGIGWFGGLLTVLLIIVLIGRTIVVARRRNRRSAGMA